MFSSSPPKFSALVTPMKIIKISKKNFKKKLQAKWSR